MAGQDGEVTASTEFAIMSMTKMVVTVAALQLVEQGSLDLDAPVDTYRLEFAEVKVLEGFDGDTPRLRAPVNTHFWIDLTSGICTSIHSNSLPFITPEALRLYVDCETAVYAAL